MESNAQKKGSTFIALRPDNTMLMQLRDEKSELYPHRWSFPGGMCDSGEEPIVAALREAEEEYELKLDVDVCKSLMEYQAPYDKNLTEYIYVCPVGFEQKPVLREGADMKWMSLEEVKRAQLGFGKAIILPKLEEFLLQRKKA